MLEPAASAHALGVWLVAAARLHEEWNGRDAAGIVVEADDIEAIDTEIGSLLLDAVLEGQEVVTEAVQELLEEYEPGDVRDGLAEGYRGAWLVLREFVDFNGEGTPTIGGMELNHPDGDRWTGDLDNDEEATAVDRAVSRAIGEQLISATAAER